ncbi:YjgF-like protein [Aaosphaeria arxii CBS 175.79]|uniref:YjgF-like protein n=1 Tax=Aaosphaeria arxii CBS 175.79 TaxID=1450172 RepID=A0A6A5Y6C5_9PLEO|nr:YjgF-like protein [Aaosphaeria arxii CBS 175.79]KAF2021078.1 YjgF-like protein [Aaosphaeria arxii CBS 175.79]
MANKPSAFNPATVPPPPTTYSQVCVTPILPTAKLITLAGQVGIDPTTKTVPTSFLEQVKIAYENVHNCLKAANATPGDIVHVKHYIVRDSGVAELDAKDVVDRGWGELWMKFMDEMADGHRPPDTVLGVAALAKSNLLYEVEVLAVINE